MSSDEKQKTSDASPTRRVITAGGIAAMIVPRHVLGGPDNQAPSDTLRIAGVGIGGMGRRYLQGCATERIVALCDVDHNFAAPVFRNIPTRVYITISARCSIKRKRTSTRSSLRHRITTTRSSP